MPAWVIDETDLKSRFLRLAALVHPDRYEVAGPPDSVNALRWATALNRAYQTLRDPGERTAYFLEINGFRISEKGTPVPTDLAEAYFDAQDGDDSVLSAFKSRLEELLSESEEMWLALGRKWNGSGIEILDALLKNTIRIRYLKSMLNDLNSRREGSHDRRH